MFKKTLKEFEAFAMRGNVIDMAVGVIIGGAFGKIADSLVKDVIMPPLGVVLGQVDFSNLFITLSRGKGEGGYDTLAQAQAAGAITLNIGLFLNTVVSFLIVAFAVFTMIRAVNRLHQPESAAPHAPTKACPYCLTQIPEAATRCPACTSNLT
ncbi:large-conductance mechanosensitive channel [Alphaproteobacteria bacterium]|nr:large-conductance mechanosensitive channel [Alphaproteobacteria bacterium]